MTETVIALYNDFSDARATIEELDDAGFDRDKISLVAKDKDEKYARYMREIDADGDYTDDPDGDEGAGFGAVVGTLTGLGVALIPGIGGVMAAGAAGAALFAGIGAAAGAVTGGLTGNLVDMGVDEEDAKLYTEGVRRGGTLVVAHVYDDWEGKAESIMQKHNPVDIEDIDEDWRTSSDENYHRTYGDFDENMYRSHYDKHYTNTPYEYDAYLPAYRYGYTLATIPEYRDADWNTIEPNARRYWEDRYDSSWDDFKDAVHHAWQNAKTAVR